MKKRFVITFMDEFFLDESQQSTACDIIFDEATPKFT